MKSFLSAAAIALVVFAVSAVPAGASIVEFAQDEDNVILHDGVGGNGGIFHVDVVSPNRISSPLINGYDFDTFCVEITEHIILGSTYHVTDISTQTVLTGKNLGSFAAWLYTEFLEPALSGGLGLSPILGDSSIPFSASVAADVNAVQKGIWKSMGWSDSQISGALTTTPDPTLYSNLQAAYAADTDWTGFAAADANLNQGTYTGNIAIMNLIGPNGSTVNAQDQLVWDDTIHPPPPPGTSPVPEPLSVVVWSLLAMCMGGVSTQRRRNRG